MIYIIILLIIYELVVIWYFYIHKHHKESNHKVGEGIVYFSFGVSVSVILNMIIFYICPPQDIVNPLPFIIIFISSCIVGPIFEEMLFRYVFYFNLRKKYSYLISIFINSLIFAIFHFDLIKGIYSFIFSLILLTFYEKKKNILVPILFHIGGNCVSLLLSEFDFSILSLAIINIIIYIYIYKKKISNN